MNILEYDHDKSGQNVLKHVIDFIAAQLIWEDGRMMEVPARPEGESRSLVMGKIHDKLWAAVITHQNDRIRAISVRRARLEEVRIYEE